MDGWICTMVQSLYKPLMEMRKMAIAIFDHQIKLESFLYSSEHNLLYCRNAKVRWDILWVMVSPPLLIIMSVSPINYDQGGSS